MQYVHMSNHLLLRDTLAAKAFDGADAKQAVAIRRLSGGVRISIGEDEALDRVREVATSFAESQGA